MLGRACSREKCRIQNGIEAQKGRVGGLWEDSVEAPGWWAELLVGYLVGR